jgi:hypothetical protein
MKIHICWDITPCSHCTALYLNRQNSLYLYFPICLHGILPNKVQGQFYFFYLRVDMLSSSPMLEARGSVVR